MSLARLTDDLPPQGVHAFGTDATDAKGGKKAPASTAVDALSKFIPTEMLAPYVALLAYGVENGAPPAQSIYWGFVIATPVVAIFFQYAKVAMAQKPWPPRGPVIWRAIAATAAFAVWGLAPPGSAFQAGVGGPAIAGLAAMFVSPVLTGADAIVLRMMDVRTV